MIGSYSAYAILRNSSLHFLLGFSVAFSVSWLILIIFHLFLGQEYIIGFGIRRCLLFLSVSLAVASHILEDYWFGWF